MKYAVFLLLALLFRPATAQPLYPLPRPDALAALAVTSAAPDTLAAIHRLFAPKRRRQYYVAGGTTLAVVGTMAALASSRPAQPAGKSGATKSGFSDLGLAFAACVTLPLIPIATLGFGGWGPRYERQVIAYWQQHRLPRRIKRALKTKYFLTAG